MPIFISLTDKRFGRLVVIKQVGKNKRGQSLWLCRCDCGKEKIVLGYCLKGGNTKSCGCLRIEKAKQRSTKHGHSKRGKETSTYRSWSDMINRCTNPNNKYWKDYGGRGITVCKRWLKFENFLKDMGERPKGLTLDRINNDKGYCKENCRWATRKEQCRNRRSSRLLEFNGKIQCIAAWAEETGIPSRVIRNRIDKLGWSTERALTTPVRKHKWKGTKNV